ncbi:hypothetical protein DFH06DRAFT_1464043 [Mycena polygramma]|nr:hypothetical protein DFH06DRAFT_1464043 [Mycena polygramma]
MAFVVHRALGAHAFALRVGRDSRSLPSLAGGGTAALRILAQFSRGQCARVPTLRTLNAAQEEASRAAHVGNVCLLGAPRSGITTALEYIAAEQRSKGGSVLLVIQRKLFLDKTKLRLLDANVDVLTWAQFVNQLFPGHLAWTDYGLREARRAGCVPQWKASSALSLIIFDNCQNFDQTQYWAITSCRSLLARRGVTPRLVIAGNPQEAIKDFCGGDVRFLERAPELFPGSPHTWTTVRLVSSFLPAPMADCISTLNLKVAEGMLCLQGSGDGPIPQLFEIDPGVANIELVAEMLAPLIRENITRCALTVRGLKHLKNHHLLRRFMAKLNDLGIPYAEPKGQVSEGEFVSLTPDDLVNHVLLVTNDHQLLGCRLDLVIVWDINTESRSNLPAVSLTRSSKHLVLLHFSERGSLPPVHRSERARAQFIRVPKNAPDRPKPPDSPPYMPSVLKLEAADSTAHLSPQVVDDIISEFLPFVEVSRPEKEILFPDSIRVDQEGSTQFIPVADINGTAVMMGLQERFSQVPSQVSPVRQAILEHADRSGWTQRKDAFENHRCDWMDGQLASAVQRAVDLVSPDRDLALEDVALEAHLDDYSLDIDKRRVVLSGRLDAIITGPSGSRIYELKFVSALAGRHIVQAALYWLMDAAPNAPPGHVFLVNVRTGQMIRIECTVDKCNALLTELVRTRYRPLEKLSDAAFFARCAGIREEVEQRRENLKLSIRNACLNALSCKMDVD